MPRSASDISELAQIVLADFDRRYEVEFAARIRFDLLALEEQLFREFEEESRQDDSEALLREFTHALGQIDYVRRTLCEPIGSTAP